MILKERAKQSILSCLLNKLHAWRVAYHQHHAHRHLNTAITAACKTDINLHKACHLVAAHMAMDEGCTYYCNLNTLPNNVAERITDAMVPDTLPDDWSEVDA